LALGGILNYPKTSIGKEPKELPLRQVKEGSLSKKRQVFDKRRFTQI